FSHVQVPSSSHRRSRRFDRRGGRAVGNGISLWGLRRVWNGRLWWLRWRMAQTHVRRIWRIRRIRRMGKISDRTTSISRTLTYVQISVINIFSLL
ncbi:hypothetical protein PENTCL1PPCAC_2420, partial [Pristionchus entomophagus]